jgi:hypothetical protein
MNGISDAVVIGVVLGLIFAAVSYYIYSRTTQIERKVGLIENILLDLKVTTEQALLNATEEGNGRMSGLTHEEREGHQHNEPDEQHNDLSGGFIGQQQQQQQPQQHQPQQAQQSQQQQGAEEETRDVIVDQAPRGRQQPAQPIVVERESSNAVNTNYELMTYKELTQLAKKMGIAGLRNQSKAFVIDAIRAHEAAGGGVVDSAPVAEETRGGGGQSDLSQWASGTVNFADGAVNPLNDTSAAGAPGAMNAVGDEGGAPLDGGDVETSLVA